MINKVSSRIILRNTSPLFDQQKYSPSNKIGVLLNENVIKVNKGSALEEFINEREEIRQKIKELNEKVEVKCTTNEENSEENNVNFEDSEKENVSTENAETDTKKQLEERLEKVDKLITGYEKGFLVNSIDKNSDRDRDGMMSLLA